MRVSPAFQSPPNSHSGRARYDRSMRRAIGFIFLVVGLGVSLIGLFPSDADKVILAIFARPRRYHYYYFDPPPVSTQIVVASVGAILICIGFVLARESSKPEGP